MKIKKIMLFAVLSAFSIAAKAQEYPVIYQAVVNGSDGKPVKNKQITVEMTVCGDETCSDGGEWQSLAVATTNEFGLFTVDLMGKNTVLKGKTDDIDWSKNKYLRVRVDFGESDFLNGMNDLGTNPFSAVPYAMAARTADVAKNAEKVNDAVLNDLTDVSTSGLKTGQILEWDGKIWKNVDKTSITTVDKLSQLTGDVELGELSDGQILAYNKTTGKWKNVPLSKTTKLTELTGDVSISELKDGQVLKFSETDKVWKNSAEGSFWRNNDNKTAIFPSGKVVIGSSSYDPDALLEIGEDATKRVKISKDAVSIPGGGSILMGGKSKAENKSGGVAKTAVGAFAIFGTVDSDHNFAFGLQGAESTITGAKGSIVFGQSCSIVGADYSAAFGNNLKIKKGNQFVCGKYNNADQEAVFVIGNGTPDNRSNAFYVTTAGKAFANGLELSSDSRLKTGVNRISGALDKVEKLRGVTFYWDSSKRPAADKGLQYGFIAQEVEKLFPELVTTDSQGFKSLNYIGIVPVLTEAVKELKQENETLKASLQDLIKRVEELERK